MSRIRVATVRTRRVAYLASTSEGHPGRGPVEDVRQLAQLGGHLRDGAFITKFRKIFCRDEMNDDLVIIPARQGREEDNSEYEEILPTSPP